MNTLLKVEDLVVKFRTKAGEVTAVSGVSFSLEKGKVLGIVGESGCGKSVTSLSILGLLPKHSGRVDQGRILFNGENLLEKTNREMRAIRGNRIAMIFQDPMTSLNPVMKIGSQITETILEHQQVSKREAWNMAADLLRKVDIPSPEERLKEYPHQLSGGMKQRVMIALAMACNPDLLIADEPTTALDVTVQAQILELMRERKEKDHVAIMLITHDMGVVAEMADDIMVMYAGQVMEYSGREEIFDRPRHPYTQGLLRSIPRLTESEERLYSIEGSVPDITQARVGCAFASRCPYAKSICHEKDADLVRSGESWVRCWKYHREGTQWENV